MTSLQLVCEGMREESIDCICATAEWLGQLEVMDFVPVDIRNARLLNQKPSRHSEYADNMLRRIPLSMIHICDPYPFIQ